MNQEENNIPELQNLIDAGCDADLIKRFIDLNQEGKRKEQLTLLSEHRGILLNKIHESQKCVDCLDYLLYQIKKSRKKEML